MLLTRPLMPPVSRREELRSASGVTLVELLVALFLLGVIFSAVANVLTSSLRAVVVQERRVEATSILTQYHEQFQSLPWDDAAIYEDELSELVDVGLAVTGLGADEVPSFEGTPIVVRPEDVVRSPTVPEAVSRPRNESERTEFEVFQVVTWSQGEGVSDLPRKRLTTIVRWQVLERQFEERLTSERAPIGGGFEDPRRPVALQYVLSPTRLELDSDGRPTEPLFVSVTFSQGMASAELRFNVVGGTSEEPELVPASVVLSPTTFIDSEARGITFTQTIDLSSFVFANGDRLFTVVGTLGPQQVEATGLVEMFGGDEATDTGSTLVIESASVSPTNMNVSDSNEKLCAPLVIEATVSGLDFDTEFQVVVLWPEDDLDLALQTPVSEPARFRLVLSGKVAGVNGSTPDREFIVRAVQGDQDDVLVAGTVSFQEFENNLCGTA